MDNDLFAYIDRLALMAFFTGYPIIYALVFFIAGKRIKAPGSLGNWLVKLLPYAYALNATLYLGMLIRNMYPDYSISNITEQLHYAFLRIFGLCALLFWIPLFSRKPIYSLLHSLLFFFFLLKDLVLQMTSGEGKDMIKNDMKIYTDSILLNLSTFAFIVSAHILFRWITRKKRRSI